MSSECFTSAVSREISEISEISAPHSTRNEKKHARRQAYVAKRQGLIEERPCSECGAEKAEMHHPDYTKPLEVVWLCNPCHMLVHKGNPPTQQERSCRCGAPARIGQWDCHNCHGTAQRIYRAREANRRAQETSAHFSDLAAHINAKMHRI